MLGEALNFLRRVEGQRAVVVGAVNDDAVVEIADIHDGGNTVSDETGDAAEVGDVED